MKSWFEKNEYDWKKGLFFTKASWIRDRIDRYSGTGPKNVAGGGGPFDPLTRHVIPPPQGNGAKKKKKNTFFNKTNITDGKKSYFLV